MELLSYEEYLAQAKGAFEYVKHRMFIGADNRTDQQERSFDKRHGWVQDLRATTRKFRKEAVQGEMEKAQEELAKVSWESQVCYPLDDEKLNRKKQARLIEINAAYAEQFGCGNCEEQSSATFQYLKDRGVKPLDWVYQAGWLGGSIGDHVFVILGRDGDTEIGDLSTWNPEVVWCDPYENTYGGLAMIQERFGGKTLSLRYRWEGDS